jgi:hypothetical protein
LYSWSTSWLSGHDAGRTSDALDEIGGLELIEKLEPHKAKGACECPLWTAFRTQSDIAEGPKGPIADI